MEEAVVPLDVPVITRPPISASAKLSPAISRLSASSESARVRAVVELSTQADLRELARDAGARGLSGSDRDDFFLQSLMRVRNASLDRLRPRLEKLKGRGDVGTYAPLTSVNALIVDGRAAGFVELAAYPEVWSIREETSSVGSVMLGHGDSTGGLTADTSWVLHAIGAPGAWRVGLRGTGVVVGIIDAGASAAHEQLAEGFRGGGAAWFDPAGEVAEPIDGMTGHGTGILSVAVGRGSETRIVGVAPAASWVACRGLPGGRYNNIALLQCADWMLTEARPDILVNPWRLPTQGCDRSLQRVVEAWRATGILPVFAAGNDGPRSSSDASPANLSGLRPDSAAALSVGGLARGPARAPQHAFARSSRGPSRCGREGRELFPSLVAPAADVPAAFPLAPDSYIATEGTSVAAGLVAGAAALLRQRHPAASVAEVEAALRAGAADLGDAGPDDTFGHGRLDIPGALRALDRLRGE